MLCEESETSISFLLKWSSDMNWLMRVTGIIWLMKLPVGILDVYSCMIVENPCRLTLLYLVWIIVTLWLVTMLSTILYSQKIINFLTEYRSGN